MYTTTPHNLHPSISSHLSTPLIASVGRNPVNGKFTYEEDGRKKECGGIIWQLKKFYYPKYKEPTRNGKAKRRRRTYQRGSTDKEGIEVHAQITKFVGLGDKRPKRMKAKTRAILNHLENELGHTLQASEIPVFIPGWSIVTQADLITMDKAGKLGMLKIKAAFPSAGYRTQKQEPNMRPPLQAVKSTKYNHWQLQREYTHRALVNAGVQIEESRIIQVKTDKRKEQGLVVNVLPNPVWTKKVPPIRKRQSSQPVIKSVKAYREKKRKREEM